MAIPKRSLDDRLLWPCSIRGADESRRSASSTRKSGAQAIGSIGVSHRHSNEPTVFTDGTDGMDSIELAWGIAIGPPLGLLIEIVFGDIGTGFVVGMILGLAIGIG